MFDVSAIRDDACIARQVVRAQPAERVAVVVDVNDFAEVVAAEINAETSSGFRLARGKFAARDCSLRPAQTDRGRGTMPKVSPAAT